MRNLIGFLILPILIFNILAPTKVSAATNPITSANIEYSYTNDVFTTILNINFRNSNALPAVINYYTIELPYQSVQNIKVIKDGKSINYTSQVKTSGVELIVNLNNWVIPSKSSKTISIQFTNNSQIDRSWGYAKLVSGINGLDIKQIKFTYPTSYPEISFVEGAGVKQDIVNAQRVATFTQIDSPSLSLLFGYPITYRYEMSKTILNDSDSEQIYEFLLPYTDNSQQFIIEKITPEPYISTIDSDNNIKLGFLVHAQDQDAVVIQGYILKKQLNIQDSYQDYETETQGYWRITNQSELNRISNTLKNHKKDEIPSILNDFVISRLDIDKTAKNSETSFESVARGGADIAINRASFAVTEDYVDLLIAALRENSVPSRMVLGYIPESSAYSKNGFFHTWVEYYDFNLKKWIILDPSTQDLFNINNINPNSPNYIKLGIRGKSPILPKLPFINSDELNIKPTNVSISENFNIEVNQNNIKNIGNIPILISLNSSNTVLLPQATVLADKEDINIKTLSRQSKFVKIELPKDNKQISLNRIVSELLLFLIFLIGSLIIYSLYARMKKKWKLITH